MERSVGALLVAVLCGVTIPGAGRAQGRVRSSVGEIAGRAFWGLSFGIPFGGVGAAVGGLIKREGWETVRDWRSRPMTPGLLSGTHAMANGDARVLLGARVRF